MAEDDQSDLPNRIKFHYIKNTFFRTIHADGAVGGITPQGMVHFALYSERPAIPELVEQALTDQGLLGQIVAQTGGEGVVRELDVDFVMSKQTATDLRDWLTQRIERLDQLQQDQMQEEDDPQ